MGACLGLATLCSQSHGAGRAAIENGLYLRRCAVVLAFALVFSTGAAWACEPLLLAVSQPPKVARCSAWYAQVQLAGVPFFWAATALQTVCDGLQDTRPGMYASLTSAAAQVALCALAVNPEMLNMGYLGMAAARSVGGIVQLVVLISIIVGQGRSAQVSHGPMGLARCAQPSAHRDRLALLSTVPEATYNYAYGKQVHGGGARRCGAGHLPALESACTRWQGFRSSCASRGQRR